MSDVSEHPKKLVGGLISGANADLFHRYEAEEARARALRDKYDRQAEYLQQLTQRLTAVLGEVEQTEFSSAQRIASIRQQLDRLERDEGAVEVRLRQKKREVSALSNALAVNRIALAYNFELSAGLDKRHVLLAPGEVEEVLGFSTYTDENGVVHKVEFTIGPEDANDESSVPSPSRTPRPASASTKPASNELVRKRASFLLLDQAKACVMRDLKGLEEDYAAGRITEFERSTQRSPLQKRLGEIRSAIEHIARADEAAIGDLLNLRPAVDAGFAERLDRQRRDLDDLKRTIEEEQALVDSRGAMSNDAWCQAVAEKDKRTFADSRREVKSQVAIADPPVAAAVPAAALRPASATSLHAIQQIPQAARPPSSSGRVRPGSAGLLRRYGSAAKSVLAAAGDRRGDIYEKIAQVAAEGNASPNKPSSGAGQAVYRFSSHAGLEAAAASNMRSFTHHMYQ